VAEDPARAGAPTAAPKATPRPSLVRTGDGERILVVDDDHMILQFVGRTLERAGYRVATASGGEAALNAYLEGRSDPFRLVLTDVLMPGLGGVDLALRLLDRDPAVRLVFMSGHVWTEPAQGAFRGAVFEVLKKPFRPEGLLQVVRRTIDRPAAT